MRVFVSYSLQLSAYTQQMATLFQSDEITLVGNQTTGVSAASIDLISKSDVFLSLLSDMSPHTFFELGYAVNSAIPVVVAVYGDVSLPIDLAGLRYLRLTGDTQVDYAVLLKYIKDAGRIEGRAIETLQGEDLVNAIRDDLYRVEELTPLQFENFVAYLFQRRGCIVTASGSIDVGYDLIVSDTNTGITQVVECKKMSRQSLVSVSTVHQIFDVAVASGFKNSAVVSNVPYTSAARALAEQQGVHLYRVQDLL